MKRYRIHKPKIVTIGGGTGLPVILKGLRQQGADITAIVTVADDGGSSGILRESINISPPGDLRNVLTALSDLPQLYEDVFQYRFRKEDNFLANHTIGNLIIAALSEMRGSTYEAIQLLSQMMHIDGRVYPASESSLTLHAIFEDGSTASGESQIAKLGKKIDQVYVTRTHDGQPAAPSRKVIKAIEEADIIVLGPGSLYTSILPNLMIEGIGKAICQAEGDVVYICNIMTQRGETEHFSDAEHVQVLHRHLAHRFINTVLLNTAPIPEELIAAPISDDYLVPVKHDFQGLRDQGCRVISSDFLELRDGGIYHDGPKVVEELFRILFDVRD